MQARQAALPILYKVTAEKAVVYADTAANAKRLGKLKEDRGISVFRVEGNWAKIRYKKQWAYVKAADLDFYPHFTAWEVASKTAIIYNHNGNDGKEKKRIGTLKKGMILDAPFSSFYQELVEFHYSSKQNGFIHISDIQPLPAYYKVIATSRRYKEPDVNAEFEKHEQYINGKWVEVGWDVNIGDTISVRKFINEKWCKATWYYIQVKNIKALPDSTAADYLDSVETGKEISRSKLDLNRSMKNAVPWAMLIVTVLSLILSHIKSQYQLTIKMIAVYLVSILALIYMTSNPDYPNPYPHGNVFAFDKHFWTAFLIYFVAAAVLSYNISLIVSCFSEIKYSQNTFIALLSLAFPAIVIAISIVFLVILMIIMIIPVGLLVAAATGSGSGAGTKEEQEKGTIYDPNGIPLKGDGSILYDSKGNTLTECYDGTYKSSDGTHYRKTSSNGNSSHLEKLNY